MVAPFLLACFRNSSGGRKSKESPVKIVRVSSAFVPSRGSTFLQARGLLNNLTESDPVVSKALADHRESDGETGVLAHSVRTYTRLIEGGVLRVDREALIQPRDTRPRQESHLHPGWCYASDAS